MITIIYGDDTASSRNYYITERGKSENSVIFEGEKLKLVSLMQSLQGGSLFDKEQEIFIENFFSSKKSNPEFKSITDYLVNFSGEAKIIIWESAEPSKTDLSLFNKPIIKQFKIPQKMFAFVDSIKPNNLHSIKLFHELLPQSAAELVFYMMIRQFRLLLAVSETEKNGEIEEVKRLAPWQISKFKSQAKTFTKEGLLTAYNKLYKIDSESKSGKLAVTLPQAIDFFLVDL